ncbi:MAG TPA: 4-alpha-glucanotransferase, partial [Pyrinomonadaceae bacterium]
MNFPRAAGILLHPTSLPGPFGIGDLGPNAYAFADFLAASAQSLWQVLPLGPTGYGDSPYACYSAFAGNTLLISPEQLVTEGLLSRSDLSGIRVPDEQRVEFERVHELKDALLEKAFQAYKRTTDTGLRSAFETFSQEQAGWLDDYALFRALKDAHQGSAWNQWEPALIRRESIALARAREQLQEQVE